MVKQKTPKDIDIFLSDYFKAIAVDDNETKNQLIKDGKEMQANYSDLARAFHSFVSTINPQIDMLGEISDTKFDILINVLKESKTLDEESEAKLKGLLDNLGEVIQEIETGQFDGRMLAEVYNKEINKGDNDNNGK